MELRTELMPPALDRGLVARLAKLAAQLDGDPDEDMRSEFNRLAGTNIPMAEFQGICGGEDHEDYVRRVLYYQQIKPASSVTRAELAEVVRRAMPQNEFFGQHDAYMAIFDANVPLNRASSLIFYPPDYDSSTNTWGGGRPMGDYDPTPEQIVEWALESGRAASAAQPLRDEGNAAEKSNS